eukprot:gene24852-33339_t
MESLVAEPSLLSVAEDNQWFYTVVLKEREQSEDTLSRKGPMPQIVLVRLLEKGIIGPTAESATLVWKIGMDEWLPIQTVPPFKSVVDFQNKQWFYIDNDGNQKGPIYSRNLLRKLRECGEVDGMSLVFSCAGDMTEWKPISEVPELKAEVVKIAMEEQASEAAMQFSESNNEIKKLLVFDMNGDSVEKPTSTVDVEVRSSTERKSFVADNGIRYCWDEGEQDWVEDDGEIEVDEPEPEKGKANKRELEDDSDSDEDDGEEVKKKKDLKADNIGASSDEKKDEGAEKKKRKNRKKKKRKGPNHWIYITGLPKDVTFEELKNHFSKVGLIEISPYDQQPKIKIYREGDEGSECKGDGSLCYNSEESVKLAIEILDGGFIRPAFQIRVTRADFSNVIPATTSRPTLSQAQVKVARSAMKQALAWNEDDDIGVKKAAALKIVVLEGMFSPTDFESQPSFEEELQVDIAEECEKCGVVEKITLFSQNVRGIVVVKFSTSYAAQECVKLMNGRFFGGRKIKSFFWDGVTNYTVTSSSMRRMGGKKRDSDEQKERAVEVGEGLPGSGSGNSDGQPNLREEDDDDEDDEDRVESSRLDEFGDWLEHEQEDLPEEFRLRTE